MSNPFAGIITASMKTMFKNAISALISEGNCSVPCRLYYGDTKWTDCPNCVFNATQNKSANIYQAGGPIAFDNGMVCPYCHGLGKIAVEGTEVIYLCVMWEYAGWFKNNKLFSNYAVQTEEGMVTTMCEIQYLPKIKRTKEAILDTNIENYVKHKVQRYGEPEPIGLGEDAFIITRWKKTGG